MDCSSFTAWITQLSAARLQSLFADTAEHASCWVRVLALEGLPQAQLCYGRMLLEGSGVPRNQLDALEWFKRAASQGNLEAYNMVGRCLENGWGGGIDLNLAAVYYHRAADAGLAWAQYNLGHLYLDGLGVPRDNHAAFRYYQSAAAQGHARAMNLVARCCEEGWGTPKNFRTAANWYRRSAEAGYFRGQYNWAVILLKCGHAEEAASWFERAATLGTPGVREAVRRVAALPSSPRPVAALTTRLQSHMDLLSA